MRSTWQPRRDRSTSHRPTEDLDGYRRVSELSPTGAGEHPRIADFSTHLSGPFASRLLSDLGATVIKIENPRTGDGNRGLPPLIGGTGSMHLTLSAGARSIAVDKRSPHFATIVSAVIGWADAVIVGARPQDAARLGLDFASVAKVKPDVVYCLISGYGESGPWKDFTAHGQTMDAMAGLVPIEWVDGAPRTPHGWRSTGTTLAGMYAALGIMYALNRQARGARGALHVSVPVWSAAMAWSWRDLACLANLGEAWNEYQDLGSRYAMYGTGDHRALIVAPVEKKFWQEFCDVADLGHLRERGNWESGMDFGRGPDYEAERAEIAGAVSGRTLEQWTDILSRTAVPFAPVLTLEEALQSDHAAALGVMRASTVGGQGVEVAATPIRITADGGPERGLGPLTSPPGIGEQTEEILGELGLGDLIGLVGAA
jgi:crotonobetainyl-CoA:carnitine CoA-transferase CaiB-like acyl-CoA transferase